MKYLLFRTTTPDCKILYKNSFTTGETPTQEVKFYTYYYGRRFSLLILLFREPCTMVMS